MLVLKWDLYIQGYAVSLNEIIEELAGTLLVREEITELLVFLREYNDKARRKVHIAGIDRSPGIEYTLLIHDYFYEMYKQKPDSCIFRLLENYYLPDYVLPLLQNTEVTESLGDFESKWFGQLYWLKIMEDSIPGVKEPGAMNYRDYIMWRNVWYALKAAGLQEGECAVVTAHWIHLNKRNVISSFYPSLGYYLAQNYGDDYCALGMLGGEGTYCAYRFKWLQYSAVCRLTLPKEGSVEKKAMETHVPYFYYPADKLPQYPACFRYMPFLYEGNFEVALNLPQRMDGFIFIRECEGRELPAGEKALDSFAKVVAKRLERILKRNDSLNIVTKSIN